MGRNSNSYTVSGIPIGPKERENATVSRSTVIMHLVRLRQAGCCGLLPRRLMSNFSTLTESALPVNGSGTQHFVPYVGVSGMLSDRSLGQHPYRLHSWGLDQDGATEVVLNTKRPTDGIGGSFAYVHGGSTLEILEGPLRASRFELVPEMWLSLPWACVLTGGSGMAVEVLYGQSPFLNIGGPIEPHGRLRYIDGCTDSLLVPPTVLGEPCFNHLHFPPSIAQTCHTHPSDRVGMVTRGRGRCVVPPSSDEPDGADIPLVPGVVFEIPQGSPHSFFTDESHLDVIAWHPDSDFGPQHDDHPMINRTMCDPPHVQAGCTLPVPNQI